MNNPITAHGEGRFHTGIVIAAYLISPESFHEIFVQTSSNRPPKCVAYLLCTTSRNLLRTGLNSSLSLRSSAIVVPTGPAVTLVSEPYLSMSVLRSLVLVSVFRNK